MMNTPSMYSVDQLLKARQNGVPDYVVVPMLQKAMAQKQAMAQQQALQQGMNPPPPVADQILDAAHNDVMQEHMARRAQEEPRGIDSLPSGIDEEDYAGGGIIAFAQGGDVYPELDVSGYANPYADNEIDPDVLIEQQKKRMGTDPAIAKQEARIGERESRLKEDEDRSPWMALMQAGLATMSGTSPNALSNIGAGATKGLESYGESQKAIASRTDKLDELRSKIEESQRAEAVAAIKFGTESAEHRKQANITAKYKKLEAVEEHNKNAMGYNIDRDKVDIERQKAADDASYHQGYLGYLKSKEGADGVGGGSAKDVRRNVMNLTNAFTNTKALLDAELAAENPNKKLIGELKYKMGAINDKLSAINSIDTSGYVPEEEPVEEPGFFKKLFSGPTPQPTPPASNGGFSIRPRQ